MQADRGLAGARAALDDHRPVERGADDDVLFGLDGGDDVAQLAGAGPLELSQQRIGHAAARGELGVIGVVEDLLEEVDEGLVVEHETPARVQLLRVGGGGPVERRSHGRPPVDHHRVAVCLLDVAASDVVHVADGLGDTPEAERSPTFRQRVQPATQVGLGLGGVGIAGPGRHVQAGLGALGARHHRREAAVGVIELGLFGGHVGVRHRAVQPRGYPSVASASFVSGERITAAVRRRSATRDYTTTLARDDDSRRARGSGQGPGEWATADLRSHLACGP